MPDSTGGNAEADEEEERVRQGLVAGSITGQQAGIARATMLKSLLQVRKSLCISRSSVPPQTYHLLTSTFLHTCSSIQQRFVRLHGMLFAHKQGEKEKEGSGPFPVQEFLAMLQTAMLDLRQLLKMSAFGDGLLLHMVVICIFSVLTPMADNGDDENSLQVSKAGLVGYR